jgi:hypothetical protein
VNIGPQAREPWLTKHQLAEHLVISHRWIELQQHVGLSYLRMGGIIRYRVSEVEAWLGDRYNSSTRATEQHRARYIANERALPPFAAVHIPFVLFRDSEPDRGVRFKLAFLSRFRPLCGPFAVPIPGVCHRVRVYVARRAPPARPATVAS